MGEFLYTTVAEDNPSEEVAITFRDQTVVVPEWVLDTIAFYDMLDTEEEEFRKDCLKVRYSRFLDRCKQEAVKIERLEQSAKLNEIQQAIIAQFRANNRIFSMRLASRMLKR